MEILIAKTDVLECGIEVGLAMTRAMQRAATQPQTAAVGA